MMYFLWFLFGGIVGALMMCLCVVAQDADRRE